MFILFPEPGDDVTESSHVAAGSLIAADAVAVPLTFTAPHAPFPPGTGTTLSATYETLDSGPEIGVSFESTTVDSLGDLLEFDGPSSDLVRLGNREKCPKFWNRCQLSVPGRLAGGGIGGREATAIGAAGDGCGGGGRISTVGVRISRGGAAVVTVALGVE